MLGMLFYFNFSFLKIFQKLESVFIIVSNFNVTKFLMFFIANIDGFFFLLWVLLLVSMTLNWVSTPVYRIINLAVLSLLMVFMWGYSLDFTFILLCYVIAFTSAVVMLFLSVVLMLPASTTHGSRPIIQNGVGFLYISWFSTLFSYENFFSILQVLMIDFFIDTILFFFILLLIFMLLIYTDELVKSKENSVFEKLVLAGKISCKNSSFSTVFRVSGMWDIFKSVDTNLTLRQLCGQTLSKTIPKFSIKDFPGNSSYNESLQTGAYDLFVAQSPVRDNLAGFYIIRSMIQTTRIADLVLDFFFEFLGCFFTVVDFFFGSSGKRHSSVLTFLNTLSPRFSKYPSLSWMIDILRFFYLEAHLCWEQEKFTYPSVLSGWETPIIFVEVHNCFIIRLLPWWSPFRIFSIFNYTIYTRGVTVLKTLKSTLTAYVEAAVQGIFVILIFVIIAPVDFFPVSRGAPVGNGINNFGIVNFESLVELKHLLYEDAPLFIFVSVILLLIALLSVSNLKKK